MRDRKLHFRTIGNWLALILMAALVSACGENQIGDITPPTVIATSPINTQTGVSVSTAAITATFSEAVKPATVNGTSFLVKLDGITPVPGTVTYAGVVARFTPSTALLPDRLYLVTVTTAVRDLVDNALANTFTWTFRTGSIPDTTPPAVDSVSPLDGATDEPKNRLIVATFTKPIDPASIGTAGFTVTFLQGGVPVAVPGTVGASGLDLIFTPGDGTTTFPLTDNTTYTARLAPTLADVAGNQLGTEYVWTFTTGLVQDISPPFVVLSSPPDGATNVCINAAITARFNEPASTTTVVSEVGDSIADTSLIVRDSNGVQVPGTVTYNGTTRFATFRQAQNFVAGVTYTATVTDRVTDRATPGNKLVAVAPGSAPNPWTFTIGLTNTVCQLPVPLRSLSSFGIVAGDDLTNTAGPTVINANIALLDVSPCPTFDPADLTQSAGSACYANGTPEATLAKADLELAFTDAEGRPRGPETTTLTGRTLEPGVYSTAGTMTLDTNGILTLDALGDSNAVWIFQVDGDLQFGEDSRIVLTNGAKAANVFWVVQGTITTDNSARLGGTLMARTGIRFANDAKVTGRVLTFGSARIRRATINLPTP